MPTRYPKAAAFVEIDAMAVTEALLKTFIDTGIPKKISSDRKTQFSSNVIRQKYNSKLDAEARE